MFASTVAAREGLHGWVRNHPDGTVELTAEGDGEALERFERAPARRARQRHASTTWM